MYEIVKNVITSGQYELTDMLKKIDTLWLQGGVKRHPADGTHRSGSQPGRSGAELRYPEAARHYIYQPV